MEDNKGKNGSPTSWICTCLASGEVFEFFTKSNADKARDSGLFKVEEAGEYLVRINREQDHG